MYTEEEIEVGRAIGLQKKPFVRQIDLIEDKFISFITNSKEAKYKKTTDLNHKDFNKPGEVKETQITSLPEILKMPYECYLSTNEQKKDLNEDLQKEKVNEIEEENKGPEKDEKHDEAKKEEEKNDTVVYVRNIDNFFFAVAKQNISIVNKVTG